jgi:hypothetical protein
VSIGASIDIEDNHLENNEKLLSGGAEWLRGNLL